MGEPSAQESIGDRIRRLRLERKMSQREVSGPGASYAYISRIEAGDRKPSNKALRIIARRLGVSVEFLETGTLPGTQRRAMELTNAELALRLEGEPEELEKAFRALLREAREDGDDDAAMRSRIGLGLTLARVGQYTEAAKHLKNAVASPAITPASRPDVFATLGRCYGFLGESSRAITLFENALDELHELAPHDKSTEIRFKSYLSSALADKGELQRARAVLLEVAESAETELDAYGRVRLYWSLSRIDSMDGDALAAMVYMRRALTLLEASEDTAETARAHLHCAEILLREGEADQATPHLARAERLFELGASHRDLGSLRTQQALRAVLREEPDAALPLAEEALSYLEEHSIDQGTAWYALGAAQALKGDVDEAGESFQRAVELLAGGGVWREAAAAYRAWGKALQQAGRDKEAYDVLEQATLLTIRHGRSTARA